MTLEELRVKYPSFKVTFHVARGKRLYTVSHAGFTSACIVRTLALVETLITEFEGTKDEIAYWRKEGP